MNSSGRFFFLPSTLDPFDTLTRGQRSRVMIVLIDYRNGLLERFGNVSKSFDPMETSMFDDHHRIVSNYQSKERAIVSILNRLFVVR